MEGFACKADVLERSGPKIHGLGGKMGRGQSPLGAEDRLAVHGSAFKKMKNRRVISPIGRTGLLASKSQISELRWQRGAGYEVLAWHRMQIRDCRMVRSHLRPCLVRNAGIVPESQGSLNRELGLPHSLKFCGCRAARRVLASDIVTTPSENSPHTQ